MTKDRVPSDFGKRFTQSIESLRITIVLVGVSIVASVATPAIADEGKADLTYETHIRPIFREHCFDCHGAVEKLNGGLDLRLVRFLVKGGESGAAIVPGKIEQSYLVERIRAGEMPPGEARLSAKDIKTIERWIASGAKTNRPEPKTLTPGLGITLEERSFWSFQPIASVVVPKFSAADRVRTPIDGLILAALRERFETQPQAGFSPDADRRTIIKRLYLDVIGILPSPDESSKWVNDKRANWYELLVDELLDSPHYGERWARHWLDVAGYADSEGYTVADSDRPWAWKYRDYVIRSLNDDKPLDQFITEQLAGDELAGARKGDLTPDQIELLTATGFLRMAADGTGSGANTAEGRNQVVADTLRIVSTSLLGLSVQCAQCHDHRYDPIPHTDYFSLRAIFEPSLDWKKWQVPNQRRVSLYTAVDRKRAAEVEGEAKKIAAEKSKKQAMYIAQALDKELMKFAEPLRAKLRAAFETPANKRTAEQKSLLKKNPSVNINPGVLYQYLPKAAEDLKTFDKRMADTRATKPKEEFLRVLIEPAGHVPETRLFHRGDHKQPKQLVEPGGLTVAAPEGQRRKFELNDKAQPTTGRRLAFAKWLTSAKHPLFARVLANRIWMHHFGRGIVSTPSDFGKLGVKPTHPKLLDWLANRLMSDGWSMKKLHRLILLSTVWRQSSEIPESSAMDSIDPTNQSYWRRSVIRLEAETLRDSMLAAAGDLDPKLFGAPLPVKTDDAGQVIVENQKRRSLYIQMKRSQPVAMLQAFDAPVMETNCEYRTVSTVATQSLMLMNGEFTLKQAAHLAVRAAKDTAALAAGTHLVTANLRQKFPLSATSIWSFGYGEYDTKTQRTVGFGTLPHWTGSSWQGGAKLPDPKLTWVILHATGGHAGADPKQSTTRRWTAPRSGVVSIAGSFSHPSPNGNGVAGRIISSRSGLAGEWKVLNNQVQSDVKDLEVQAGDTMDFMIDSLGNVNTDSFNWQVKVTLTDEKDLSTEFHSKTGFHGPNASYESLPNQAFRVWQLALCREPTEAEMRQTLMFLSQQLTTIQLHANTLPKGVDIGTQAITNLSQALLTSNEFLYVD